MSLEEQAMLPNEENTLFCRAANTRSPNAIAHLFVFCVTYRGTASEVGNVALNSVEEEEYLKVGTHTPNTRCATCSFV